LIEKTRPFRFLVIQQIAAKIRTIRGIRVPFFGFSDTL
jgi:hypothetical protein